MAARERARVPFCRSDPTKAFPVFPSPLDGLVQREQIIVANIKELETSTTSQPEQDSKNEEEHGTAKLPLRPM